MMLTKQEKNELTLRIMQYHEAWSDYVKDVAEDAPTRHGAGALVMDRYEELNRFVKEDL
jgi:hypothetical protein